MRAGPSFDSGAERVPGHPTANGTKPLVAMLESEAGATAAPAESAQSIAPEEQDCSRAEIFEPKRLNA